MKKEKLKRTQLYISEESHKKLHYYCILENKSISEEVREAVEQYIAVKDESRKVKTSQGKILKDPFFKNIGLIKSTESVKSKSAKSNYSEKHDDIIYSIDMKGKNKK
jgi:hypothetical protein